MIAAVDRFIAFLNGMDGETDLEPSMGHSAAWLPYGAADECEE